MSETVHNFSEFDQEPASDLTVTTLVGLMDEYALDGSREDDSFKPIIFQNHAQLKDGRELYVTRYYELDGSEMPVDKRIGDILIYDSLEDESRQRQSADSLRNFTNYYFINAGMSNFGDQQYRVEKHRIQSSINNLMNVLENNDRADNADYLFEQSLGYRILSESEAMDVIMLLAKEIDTRVEI